MLRTSDCDRLALALSCIGVTVPLPESADWPVFEGNYIKFMAGHRYDSVAADQLELWLIKQGYSYERHRDRAIRDLDRRAVVEIARAFGMSNDEIVENFDGPDRQVDIDWFRSTLEGGSVPAERQTWSAPVVA